MGLSCFQNGRPSPSKDCHVRRTLHRERGVLKKRFKDSLKKLFTTCNIDHKQWSDLAAGRVAWHHTIHQAAAQFAADSRNSLNERDRGGRPAPPLPPHQTLLFPANTARGPVSPASVWSATSLPTVDDNVDKLHKSLFAKPSHND